MAVTLIVEDGTIVAGANTYVSLVDADAYFAGQGNQGAAWAAPDELKNEYLANAAAALDATYGQRYLSYMKDNTNQPLLWPREDLWDRHSRRHNYGTIPLALQNAQCEMALLVQAGVDLYPEGSASDNLTSESVQIGEISQSFTYNQPPRDTAQYDGFRKVEQILWAILRPETKAMRFAI